MTDEEGELIARSVQVLVDGATAADDMLLIICMHLATVLPDRGVALRAQLLGLLANPQFDASVAFRTLAQRLADSLPEGDFVIRSVQKRDRQPLDPDELRKLFRLVRGGTSASD